MCKNVDKTTPELAAPLRRRSDHDPGTNERVPKPSAGQASPSIFRDTLCPAKHSISCICYLSKTDFVRDFPQKVISDSWRCENEAFVRDFRQNLKVEDVETKLSCETSLKSESGRCENEAFVRDFSWLWDFLAVRSLGCEISWLWDLLAVRSLGCGISWLWDLLAVEISWLWNLLAVGISWLWDALAVEISWLWDLLAVRSLGCEISWLWDLLAVRPLGCEISWLWRCLGCEISWPWNLCAVRSLGCEISWLWRSLGCEISWLWRSLGCEISWLWRSLGCEISWLWRSLGCEISCLWRSLGCEISCLWRSLGCEISWLWDLMAGDISWLWWIGFRKSATRKLTFKLPLILTIILPWNMSTPRFCSKASHLLFHVNTIPQAKKRTRKTHCGSLWYFQRALGQFDGAGMFVSWTLHILSLGQLTIGWRTGLLDVGLEGGGCKTATSVDDPQGLQALLGILII